MALSISNLLFLGLVLRLALLMYGAWQDSNMVVKFTDVDYNVFHDAAEYITKVSKLTFYSSSLIIFCTVYVKNT